MFHPSDLLPESNEDLADLMIRHCASERSKLAYRMAYWKLARLYMAGYRRFDVYDVYGGRVGAHVLDKEDNLEYQDASLLKAINDTVGRLASYDLTPYVSRQGHSLAGIRDRAVAQIMADDAISRDHVDATKTPTCYYFAKLGGVGLTGHLLDHPSIGLTGQLETVHPQEILPYPTIADDYTKATGKVRERLVPYDFLTDIFGKKKVSAKENELDLFEVEYGSAMENTTADLLLRGSVLSASNRRSSSMMRVARLRELWLEGPRGTCSEYAAMCGRKVFQRQSFVGVEVYCPLAYERFMENGTFHGAGVFDLLYSVSRRFEMLVKTLFNNQWDQDRFGTIVLPQGAINSRALKTENGGMPKVLMYQMDPMEGTDFRPIHIPVPNSGDMPGRVATFAQSLMRDLSPVRDLIREKGRGDSAVFMNFLDEQVNRAMSTPSRGLDRLYGQVYKVIVGEMGREIIRVPRSIPVNRLTLDLAGAVIDPASDTVSFETNPIPNLSRLSFGVKETNPQSMTSRKAEAVELQKMKMQVGASMDDLSLFGAASGLDFAMWDDDIKAAYEMIVRNILLLYGDGETPGEILVTPFTARPDVQLRVLGAFMSSPTMAVASAEVMDQFADYQEQLKMWSGNILPSQIPDFEDLSSQGLPPSGNPGTVPQLG